MSSEMTQVSDASPSDGSSGSSDTHSHIREVWAYNLEDEMDMIRDIADSYPYIAMVCALFSEFDRI